MLGAFFRAASGFAAGMLVATAFKVIANPVLDIIKPSLGSQHMIVVALEGARDQFPFVVLLMAATIVLVSAVVENRLPGGI